MSIATITEAQRMTLRSAAVALEHRTQHFAQNALTPTAAGVASFQPIGDAAANALAVAGHGTGVLPATSAVVANGDAVPMKNSAGSKTVSGTAAVASGAVSGVSLPATAAIVDSTVLPVIQNSAGTTVPGTNARNVAAGLETNVRMAATVGVVVNGVKQSGWTVTGSGTFFTPTVTNGVCTGGVLSAS